MTFLYSSTGFFEGHAFRQKKQLILCRLFIKTMSVTDTERAALGEFCKVHRITEDIKREMKLQARQLADVKKTGIQELTEMLQESKSSIYRLEVPNDSSVEEFPAFVRLKRTSTSRSLTPELLEQAVNNITRDIIAELAEKESTRSRKKRKTSAGAATGAAAGASGALSNDLVSLVAEAVLTAIRKTRSTEKQVADITSSLPRGTDESVITDAPPEIQKYVQEIVGLQNKLKRINKQYKEELTALQQREEEVRQEVDNFLKRGNKDSFKLNVNVDGDRVHYFIRRRKVVTKKPMSVSELKDHVNNTVSGLLRTAPRVQSVQDLSEGFIEALRSSVYQTLMHHLQNRERLEEEKILLHRGRGQSQNLQVYESEESQTEQEED